MANGSKKSSSWAAAAAAAAENVRQRRVGLQTPSPKKSSTIKSTKVLGTLAKNQINPPPVAGRVGNNTTTGNAPSKEDIDKSKSLRKPVPFCWFNFDQSGMMLVSATYFCLLFSGIGATYCVIIPCFAGSNRLFPSLPLSPIGLFVIFTYLSTLILSFTSHIRTQLTQPGLIPIDWEPPKEAQSEMRWCRRCNHWKPDRAHHCRVCDRCIFRMDHYCPWVNNCVGFNNQRMFILFLIYIALLSIMSLLLLVYEVFFYFTSTAWETNIESAVDPTANILLWQRYVFSTNLSIFVSIGLAGMSGFFLFFVSDFLFEQVESIDTNATLVETYQAKRGRRIGLMPQLKEVMGQQPYWWWYPMPNPNEADFMEPVFADEAPMPQGEMDEDEAGVVPTDESSSYEDDYSEEEEDNRKDK